MPIYLCRMHGYDDADAWTHIHALDAGHAAKLYAQQCHAGVDGELFETHGEREIVEVKNERGQVESFQTGFEDSDELAAWKAAA